MAALEDWQHEPLEYCKTGCEYGACGDPGIYAGPYGCGGCCRCLGGCQVQYELEHAMIPETPAQYVMRLHWERTAPPEVQFPF